MVTGYLRRSRPRLRALGRGKKWEVVTFVEVVLVCEPWEGEGRGRWLPSSKSSSSASRGKGKEVGGGYLRRSRPRLRAVGRESSWSPPGGCSPPVPAAPRAPGPCPPHPPPDSALSSSGSPAASGGNKI